MKTQNESGIHPVEYKILVQLDEVEQKTTGGVFIPDMVRDQKSEAQERATFIDGGGSAFEGWKGHEIPSPGSRVLIARYEGRAFTGKDGRRYRLMHDKDLVAFIDQGV